MEKFQKLAIQKSENVAKKMNSVAHHYDHADRVRKLAIELGKGENLSDRELFIVEIAALWHDVGLDYVKDRSVHPQKSAEIFLETFSDSTFSTEEKDFVSFLLKYHDKYEQSKSNAPSEKSLVLLRVLIDADTLELLGERGYERAVETAKSRNWPNFDGINPLGETSGYSSKQFDNRFQLKREGKIPFVIEQTLIGQLNFQISCADLLFTELAKDKAVVGVKYLRDKIQSILQTKPESGVLYYK